MLARLMRNKKECCILVLIHFIFLLQLMRLLVLFWLKLMHLVFQLLLMVVGVFQKLWGMVFRVMLLLRVILMSLNTMLLRLMVYQEGNVERMLRIIFRWLVRGMAI